MNLMNGWIFAKTFFLVNDLNSHDRRKNEYQDRRLFIIYSGIV